MNLQAHKAAIIGGTMSLVLVGVLGFKGLPNSSLLQRIVIKEGVRLPNGAIAPEFKLSGINSEPLGLKELGGNWSVLVFVTPTCPYCKQLKETLVDKGLPELKKHLVFITSKAHSPQEVPAEVQELESKVEKLFLVLQDSTGSTAEAYRASSVPTSYLLDKTGKIVDSGIGVPDGLKLVQRLVDETLLAKNEACASCQ